jgi:hypothetical protein
MLKIVIVTAVIFLVPFTSIFTAQTSVVSNVQVKSSLSDQNEFIFTYDLSELIQTQIETSQGLFTLLTIPNSGFIGDIGQPQIPMYSELYAIPSIQATVNVIDYHIQETRNVGNILPCQPPQTDRAVEKTADFSYDVTYYQQDIIYPYTLVEITDIGKIRDIPFVRIEFHPVQYMPNQGIITIYDRITIKVTYETPDATILVDPNFVNNLFYPYYENVFANWDSFYNSRIGEKDHTTIDYSRNSGCDYLIITHPNFYSQAQNLAEWKHRKGLNTKIVNVTNIGSTATVIRQYIQNAYNTWTPKPSYLLLIGDAEYVPTNYVYSAASDLWYATVDGSDYYADMFFGRIPADTSSQANIMIQKILAYEQTPPTLSTYYSNFTVAAYFQDDEHNGYETRRFVRTSEEVRDYLLTQGYNGERIYVTESYITPTHYNYGYYGNGEPLPPELLRSNGFPWDGDSTDIVNSLNEGIFILNHRDHGSEYGWGDPYFNTGNIASLTNGVLQPVVFSINCLTGRFDNYECFCEEFVRKPNAGAVAAFGATRVSYSGYNDFLCRGFYDSIWPNFDTTIGSTTPMYELGAILNYGKYYMANTWGNPWGYERYSFELFHVFGDPSMKIWTSLPQNMTVTHPPELYLNTSAFTVHVEDSTDTTINNAYVCLSKDDEVYLTGYTDSSGNITFYPSPSTLGKVNVTVTIHNYLPYIGEATVTQGNLPPNPPSNPIPSNGSIDITINTDLSWNCSDPNGDTLSYTIYFEANDTTPDILVSTNQSATTYDPGTLNLNTQYYWQIFAWDDHGATTSGSIWMFTTEQGPNNPPYQPANPNPVDGATDIDVNSDLSWTGGDPDPGDTVTYDVYFGTTSSPPLVINNQSTTTYDPGTMTHEETYYWQIIAWDNHGSSTSGPLWNFITGIGTNNPPNLPTNPTPINGSTDISLDTILSWDCIDPDGDALVYDIYFEADDATPDILVSDDQPETNYTPTSLDYDTTYYWQITAKDPYGATTSGPIWTFTTKQGIPDLTADGTLSWTDIKPGSTVTGSFIVKNIGDPLSQLDWSVESYPEWGNWTIIPTQGFDLTPEDGEYTIDVTIIAPNVMNKQFSGNLKIINLENPDDYDTIYVSLATPHTQQSILQILLNRLFNRFPNAFPLLKNILQNTL